MRSVWPKLPHISLLIALILMMTVGVASAAEDTYKFKAPRPIELLNDPEGAQPHVFMDGDSTTHIIEIARDASLVYRRIFEGSTPTAPVTLAAKTARDDDYAIGIQASMDASDQLHVLWQGKTGDTCVQTQLYYATVINGVMSQPLPVGAAANECGAVIRKHMRVEPSGRAHIFWVEPGESRMVKRIVINKGVASQAHDVWSADQAVVLDFGVDRNGNEHVLSLNFEREVPIYTYHRIALNGTINQTLVSVIGYDPTESSIGKAQVLVTPTGSTSIVWEFFYEERRYLYHTQVNATGSVTVDRQELVGNDYAGFGGGYSTFDVALDGQGSIHALTRRQVFEGPAEVVYAYAKPGSAVSRKTLVSTMDYIEDMEIEVGPTNKPTMVWEQVKIGSEGFYRGDIFGIRPGSSTIVNISRGSTANDELVALADDPLGGAVTLWRAEPGNTAPTGIFASTYD